MGGLPLARIRPENIILSDAMEPIGRPSVVPRKREWLGIVVNVLLTLAGAFALAVISGALMLALAW
jgi:hypothetical protein